MTEQAPAPQPLAGLVVRGAMMMVGLRFAMRALGLISVFFTARLLSPTDFGVVGTSSIVLGLFATLQATGLGDALVRLRKLEPEHLHTCWTINLIAATLVSCGIWLSAPAAARFLEEPALIEVLSWQAFTPTIVALLSPGTMKFMRDFDFGKEFTLRIFQKVVLIVCVVTGAWLTRSYWGLVWGTMTGTFLNVAMSYVLFPYRPRLSLMKHRDFLAFSFWTMIQSFATYSATVVDEVIVRRIATTQMFGLYHVSRDLSRSLVSDMVAPAAAALLPGLARLRDEPARFLRAAQVTAGVGALIAVGAGLGVSCTAAEVTGLLLGAKWDSAAPYLALTAIGSAAQTLAGLHRSILAALDRQHWSAALWALRASVLATACSIAAGLGGMFAVAVAFASVSVMMTILDYIIIFARLGRPTAPLAILVRPLLAGAAMVGVLALVPAGLPLGLSAALKVGVGFTTYVLTVLLLWWVSGRRDGAETALIQRLPPRFCRLALRRVAGPTST